MLGALAGLVLHRRVSIPARGEERGDHFTSHQASEARGLGVLLAGAFRGSPRQTDYRRFRRNPGGTMIRPGKSDNRTAGRPPVSAAAPAQRMRVEMKGAPSGVGS